MATVSTKGLVIRMENNANTRTPITITAVSAAAPAVVSAATPPADGTIIYVPENIGVTEIAGKFFISGNAGVGDFELLESDTTAGTSGLLTSAGMQGLVTSSMMTIICASAITVDNNVPGTISVATFCDPSASIPATVTELGNVTLSVFHDLADAGFQLLKAAGESATGNTRAMTITFPNAGGVLISSGVISSFGLADVPLDGAAAWQATFALATRPALRV